MKPGGANEEPIVSDITFFVEFVGSIAVVAVPIVVLLRLLAANGASGITDLFVVTGRFDIGAGAPEEETPPRWHPERLAPRRPAATTSEDCVTPRNDPGRLTPSAVPGRTWAEGTGSAADGSVRAASWRGSGRAG
jgi:hypothetical protein